MLPYLCCYQAKEHCNGLELDGRKIRVDYSITKRAHTPTPGVYMGKPTRSSHEERGERGDRGDRGGGGRYDDHDDYHDKGKAREGQRERGGGKEGGNERKRKRDAVAPPYVCHTCTHISLCLQVVLAMAVATKRSYCATLFPLATLHHTLYVLKIVTHAL